MRIEDGFQPTPFSEQNAYTNDPVLPDLLKRSLPKSIFEAIEQDLVCLGTEVVTTIRSLSDSPRVHPPTLIQYDQWGQRIDHLQTSEGWRELKVISQREGIPGIFYERKYNEFSRIYGFAKLRETQMRFIFCPMGMTDGTARVIELMGSPKMKGEIFPRLISRDPALAYTSGQWMTERPGGSDISQTETVAHPTGSIHGYGHQYILNGVKWFSSATDSEVAVALARTGSVMEGSRGLSLFLVPLRLPLVRNPLDPIPSPTSNNILVHRLKNKVGTHILPTAELNLESAEGYLIGSLGQGVKNIAPMLNITRLWSAMSSVGKLRKCLAIATSYAKVRAIQSGALLLMDKPIHVEQLASVNLLYRALTHLTFGVIGLLGKAECGTSTSDELCRLRILTPVVKGYSAEKACTGMEEAMSAMGGAGYMEENGFGRAIRDSLVEKIWEGTIVVLALDLIRTACDPETMKAFTSWANSVIESCPTKLEEQIIHALAILKEAIDEFASSFQQPIPPLVPRPALMLAGVVASSIYLLEHAVWSFTTSEASLAVDVEVFERWVIEGDAVVAIASVRRAKKHSNERFKTNSTIVFGPPTKPKL